jgi:hypothetical protein
MIPVDLEKHPKLTENLIQMALAYHLQWWTLTMVPNWCRFHEMDMAVLTKAGYLWEYEIKISQSDWEADRKKDELRRPDLPATGWNRPTRNLKYVKRFNYVYAHGLRCPDWVPDWAGLLEADYHTSHRQCYIRVKRVREAKDRKVEKLDAVSVRRMFQSTYHRYWRMARDKYDGVSG